MLPINALKREYAGVLLCFKLGRKDVCGLLNGSANDWTFESVSPAFIKHLPTGRLHKYAVWHNKVPSIVSNLYNGIWDAAFKAGYDLGERDDQVLS